jgi:hypothetical protein
LDLPALDLLQAAVVAMGIAYLFFRCRDARYAILFLGFCIPSCFLLESKLYLFLHYFICLYPIQFVVIGIVANALLEAPHWGGRIMRFAVWALLAVLAAYQASSSIEFVTSIAAYRQLPWPGYGEEYGPPFRFRVQEIKGLAQRGIVSPEEVQKQILATKPPSEAPGYDFAATKYIVENLHSIP